MNTTLTRMVYDRMTRQQQLSIAIASPQNNTDRKVEITGIEPVPPISERIIKPIISLSCGVVALITRIAVRRDGVWYTLLRKGEC